MNTVTGKHADVLLNMPNDMEIIGRIYYQALEVLGQNLFFIRDEEIKERFLSTILDVMIKLEAMKYHRDNFELLENQYIQMIKEGSAKEETYLNRTHLLLFELESFLFQLKSTLDLSVKILGGLIPGRFRVQTFQDKGEKLITGLRKYMEDKSCKSPCAENLIEMLSNDKEAWLERAVKLRDDIAHYKTFHEFNYSYSKYQGKESFIYPKISGMEPLKYIDLVYQNCIEFIQDFMCLSIDLFFPNQLFVGLKENGSCNVGEPLSKYIKYGFGIKKENSNNRHLLIYSGTGAKKRHFYV